MVLVVGRGLTWAQLVGAIAVSLELSWSARLGSKDGQIGFIVAACEPFDGLNG